MYSMYGKCEAQLRLHCLNTSGNQIVNRTQPSETGGGQFDDGIQYGAPTRTDVMTTGMTRRGKRRQERGETAKQRDKVDHQHQPKAACGDGIYSQLL